MKKCPFQKYESSPGYHKYAGSFWIVWERNAWPTGNPL